MEANGAASPGALVLVAGLSKPFRRLDKYDGILQELKRYMEESHVDRGDVSRSISVYKNIAVSINSFLSFLHKSRAAYRGTTIHFMVWFAS